MDNTNKNYKQIIKEIAPCGIDCSRCVSYIDGDIAKLCQSLLDHLSGFEKMAGMMKNFEPLFNNYENFIALLTHFSKASCPGCRNGAIGNTMCAAKDCHKTEQVDFCFQCPHYPCTKNHFNDKLHHKWLANNNAMKENGVEAFYTKQKSLPRY